MENDKENLQLTAAEGTPERTLRHAVVVEVGGNTPPQRDLRHDDSPSLDAAGASQRARVPGLGVHEFPKLETNAPSRKSDLEARGIAPFIRTISGKEVNYFNPTLASIDLGDIFHALAKIPRFNGHTRVNYSVLTHSFNVAKLVPEGLERVAALHDAAEAYIGDIPTPLKLCLGETLRYIEHRLESVISARFHIPNPIPAEVIEADRVMLCIEAINLNGRNEIPGWLGKYSKELALMPEALERLGDSWLKPISPTEAKHLMRTWK